MMVAVVAVAMEAFLTDCVAFEAPLYTHTHAHAHTQAQTYTVGYAWIQFTIATLGHPPIGHTQAAVAALSECAHNLRVAF